MAIARITVADPFYNTADLYVEGTSQYICEEEADVAKLPTNGKVAVGSRAVVIPTGEVYILGPTKGWIK